MKTIYTLIVVLLATVVIAKAQSPAIHTSNNGGMITKRFYDGTSNNRLAHHTTGIKQTESNIVKDSIVSFGLHPNPVQNTLSITPKQITDGDYSYYITSNDGVRVAQGKLSNGTAQVSVEHLPVAPYTLNVTKGNTAISSYTFVKN